MRRCGREEQAGQQRHAQAQEQCRKSKRPPHQQARRLKSTKPAQEDAKSQKSKAQFGTITRAGQSPEVRLYPQPKSQGINQLNCITRRFLNCTSVLTILHSVPYMYEILSSYSKYYTSSAAQGGGGSFKNRKPIGEVGCCESRMAERIH